MDMSPPRRCWRGDHLYKGCRQQVASSKKTRLDSEQGGSARRHDTFMKHCRSHSLVQLYCREAWCCWLCTAEPAGEICSGAIRAAPMRLPRACSVEENEPRDNIHAFKSLIPPYHHTGRRPAPIRWIDGLGVLWPYDGLENGEEHLQRCKFITTGTWASFVAM